MTVRSEDQKAKPKEPDSPFPGPRPYAKAESTTYSGRDALRDELVLTILAKRTAVVVGSSGAGKSSLLNAGVVPYLEDRHNFVSVAVSAWAKPQGAQQNSPSNVFPADKKPTTPAQIAHGDGRDTLLAKSVMKHAEYVLGIIKKEIGFKRPPLVPFTSDELTPSGDAPPLPSEAALIWKKLEGELAEILRWFETSFPGCSLLIVLDQFEDLLSTQRDPAVIQGFIRWLAPLFLTPPPFLYSVVALRDDYLGRMQEHGRWYGLRSDGSIVINQMTIGELRRAAQDAIRKWQHAQRKQPLGDTSPQRWQEEPLPAPWDDSTLPGILNSALANAETEYDLEHSIVPATSVQIICSQIWQQVEVAKQPVSTVLNGRVLWESYFPRAFQAALQQGTEHAPTAQKAQDVQTPQREEDVQKLLTEVFIKGKDREHVTEARVKSQLPKDRWTDTQVSDLLNSLEKCGLVSEFFIEENSIYKLSHEQLVPPLNDLHARIQRRRKLKNVFVWISIVLFPALIVFGVYWHNKLKHEEAVRNEAIETETKRKEKEEKDNAARKRIIQEKFDQASTQQCNSSLLRSAIRSAKGGDYQSSYPMLSLVEKPGTDDEWMPIAYDHASVRHPIYSFRETTGKETYDGVIFSQSGDYFATRIATHQDSPRYRFIAYDGEHARPINGNLSGSWITLSKDKGTVAVCSDSKIHVQSNDGTLAATLVIDRPEPIRQALFFGEKGPGLLITTAPEAPALDSAMPTKHEGKPAAGKTAVYRADLRDRLFKTKLVATVQFPTIAAFECAHGHALLVGESRAAVLWHQSIEKVTGDRTQMGKIERKSGFQNVSCATQRGYVVYWGKNEIETLSLTDKPNIEPCGGPLTFSGQSINDVALSRSGDYLAVLLASGKLSIFESSSPASLNKASGAQKNRLSEHSESGLCPKNRENKLWKLLRELTPVCADTTRPNKNREPNKQNSVRISFNGDQIAVKCAESPSVINIFDRISEQWYSLRHNQQKDEDVVFFNFFPKDGRAHLATVSKSTVHLWNLRSIGKVTQPVPPKDLQNSASVGPPFVALRAAESDGPAVIYQDQTGNVREQPLQSAALKADASHTENGQPDVKTRAYEHLVTDASGRWTAGLVRATSKDASATIELFSTGPTKPPPLQVSGKVTAFLPYVVGAPSQSVGLLVALCDGRIEDHRIRYDAVQKNWVTSSDPCWIPGAIARKTNDTKRYCEFSGHGQILKKRAEKADSKFLAQFGKTAAGIDYSQCPNAATALTIAPSIHEVGTDGKAIDSIPCLAIGYANGDIEALQLGSAGEKLLAPNLNEDRRPVAALAFSPKAGRLAATFKEAARPKRLDAGTPATSPVLVFTLPPLGNGYLAIDRRWERDPPPLTGVYAVRLIDLDRLIVATKGMLHVYNLNESVWPMERLQLPIPDDLQTLDAIIFGDKLLFAGRGINNSLRVWEIPQSTAYMTQEISNRTYSISSICTRVAELPGCGPRNTEGNANDSNYSQRAEFATKVVPQYQKCLDAQKREPVTQGYKGIESPPGSARPQPGRPGQRPATLAPASGSTAAPTGPPQAETSALPPAPPIGQPGGPQPGPKQLGEPATETTSEKPAESAATPPPTGATGSPGGGGPPAGATGGSKPEGGPPHPSAGSPVPPTGSPVAPANGVAPSPTEGRPGKDATKDGPSTGPSSP